MDSISTPPQSFTSVLSLCSSTFPSLASGVYRSEGSIEDRLKEVQLMLREIINYLESIECDGQAALSNGIGAMHTLFNNPPKMQQFALLCKDRAVAIFILGHM